MEGKRKTRIGRVVSDKMDKTVIVAVEHEVRHPLYKKTIRKVVKYQAHNKNNESRRGDIVRIEETRPLSKEKRWRIAGIITKAAAIEVQPEEIT